jgi:hypothetical protein
MAFKPAHYARQDRPLVDKQGIPAQPDGVGAIDALNVVVERTGGPMFAAMRLPSYAKAALPSATDYHPGLVFVSDEAGGAVIAFSDGAGNWRRVTDRAIVS